MAGRHLFARSFCVIVALVFIEVGMMAGSAGAETTEILKITVGEPTTLSSATKQDCSSVAASRTGVAAAFYPPRPRAGPEVYRISRDGGVTWGEELPWRPHNPHYVAARIMWCQFPDGLTFSKPPESWRHITSVNRLRGPKT